MSRRYIYAIFIIVGFSFFTSSNKLVAQTYVLKNYTIADGLPSAATSVTFQDSKGLIWISTQAGICKFDGTYFTSYSRKDGLISNYALAFTEDRQGNLWIGTAKGISVFDGIRFRTITVKNGLVNDHIAALYCDHKNRVWIGTMKGLSMYENDSFINNTSLGAVTSIIEDPHHRVILGTDTGAFIVHGNNYLPMWNHHRIPMVVTSMVFDNKDILYMVGPHQIGKLDKQGFSYIPFPEEIQYFLSIIRNNGELIISTKHFLYRLTEKNLFEKICVDDYKHNLFMSNAFTDREDNIWVNSATLGIVKMKKSFIENFLCEPAISSLCNKEIQDYVCARKTTDGHILLNSLKSVISIDPRDSVKILYTAAQNQRISSALQDKKNNLWIGILPNLVLKQESNGRITQLPYPDSAIGLVNYMYEDSYGIVWIGLLRDLIYYSNGKLHNFNALLKHNKIEFANSVIETGKGMLIFGTVNGMYMYDYKRLYKLNNYSVRKMYKDSRGFLWVGSSGWGLLKYRIDPVSYRITPVSSITKDDGLSTNFVQSVCEDNKGNLWLGTNVGISHMEISGRKDSQKPLIWNFTSEDGIFKDFWRHIDLSKDLNGDIWAATTVGVMKLNMGRYYSMKHNEPILHITEVYTENNDHFQSFKADILHDKLPYNTEFSQNNISIITFNYAGILFNNTQSITYETMLDGFDEVWRSQGNKRNISYTNLPPGEYVFKVRATNHHIQWTGPVREFAFTITPPFWQTLWFILFITVSIPSLLIFLVKKRITQIKKEEAQKTYLNKKLNELEMSVIRAQLNPHFIFNALNSIQKFIVSNENNNAYNYLAKFAKLLRKILDSTSTTFISLQEEVEMIKIYLEIESLRFDNQFKYTIETNEQLDLSAIFIPTMILQPYVENALWHGLIPKTADREMKIRIDKDATSLILIVEDNGIGRKRAREIKQKREMNYESRGLRISKDRLALLNQKKDNKATVEIIDLYDDDQNAIGTLVKIRIRLDLINMN